MHLKRIVVWRMLTFVGYAVMATVFAIFDNPDAAVLMLALWGTLTAIALLLCLLLEKYYG